MKNKSSGILRLNYYNALLPVTFLALMGITTSVNAQVYFQAYPSGGNEIFVNAASGFIGPLPNVAYTCYSGNSPDSCSNGAGQGGTSTSGNRSCEALLVVKSLKNKTTGKDLTPSRDFGAINVGGAIINVRYLFGIKNAYYESTYETALCSSHAGDSVPVPIAAPGGPRLYPSQGYSPGDVLEICLTEQFINVSGVQGPDKASHYGYAKGVSYCSTVDSVAPTCQLIGDMAIDLGTVGINNSAIGTTSANIVCPADSSIKLTMVKMNPAGTIPLKNSSGDAIDAKTRMKVAGGSETNEWTGIVKGTTPVVFSANVANVGTKAGVFSGETVIIMNNN